MTEQTNNTTNNITYVSNNREFSSLDKSAVQKWEQLGLRKDELTHEERNLWRCKGEIQTSSYTISFLNGREIGEMTVQSTFYSEALKKVKKHYPNAVFLSKEDITHEIAMYSIRRHKSGI